MGRRRSSRARDEAPFALTHPVAKLRPLRPQMPTRAGDPFRLVGPAVLNVSGGRTSGYMLRRHLDAHHGQLPPDVHVVFCNTGKERAETLAFVHALEVEWDVRIRWLERAPGPHLAATPHAARFVEVDYDSASTAGEPFEQLIRERQFLPNSQMRFCTAALKIEVAESFMRAQGYETWTNVVGLRRDEPTRVAKHAARNAAGKQDWTTVCPLYDAGVLKAGVEAFWARSHFDLALKSWESNCDMCFFKKRKVREQIVREHPEFSGWWERMEALVGARFIKDEPGYARVADKARRQLPVIAEAIEEADDEAPMGCNCTDRRRARCNCRRTGRGHTLACVLGRAA